ncbi:MAG: S9 family peptidase [Nannocystis sp.]|uniref:prolyl oligopeptidase family serine peptidase n=1 Tax=Nannocystis sp. TaxID=1962667 RepID=UPI002422D947|nr:prolyl oligopeptidase family serine peptidase [Nannocystis sp.]MBK9757411.1 S9 family peptidase [Nannocystis sp.]
MPAPLAVVALSLLLAAPRAPTARQVDEVVVTLHGEARHDEYAWLRAGGEDPAVRRHLAAENAYAAALMRPYAGLMRALAREIDAGTYVDHESVPVRRGAWLYWTRSERRRELPLYLRRRVDAPPGAAPQQVLDPEALARGKAFFDLELFELSDDGRYLAYSTDEIGAENYTLYIKDLETGELGPDRLQRVTSAAWSADGAELLYTVRDDAFRSYALHRHRRGETGPDPLVLREDDAKYELSVRRTRSGEWFILAADSYGASEARVARADAPTGSDTPWVTIAARRPGHLYDLDHAGDTFYVRSNYETPNFRVMTAPEDDPRPARWRPLVPGRADVAITDVDAFRGKLVLSQRERGRPGLEVVDLATGGRTRVGEGADADVYTRGLVTITVGENPDPLAARLRVYVESVKEPERTLDIELADGRQTLLQQRPATGPCGGAGATPGATIGAARAADGVEIQYLYFAGAGPVGSRPLLLEAYGAYGSVYDPDHDPTRCALLDRGVDFVIAWVRGGGELGEPWHDAARVRLRERSAGDLIAVAEALIAEGRTTAGQLVIAGESAGGGLMGAALNARPELFAGAVLRVPFLDAVGTMADASAPLTTIEYEEWGDPRVRADYDVMRRWCPYTNLGAREYPPILVLSSLADSRVEYHEQARYVARARAQGRGGPFLLRTEMHGGHGGASSRRAFVQAQAFTAAFILGVGELRRRAR